ncbi:PhzF family phenazine biosynthesis protein [Sporomusa malonica]|uniref:Phenazine biosynthesis protein PhzF family n=1 Tax=Sporomusa malonica TaxID=112901 RepID=A0A1W1YGS8_9FIRM|nr:PhzF family phenazine biosynthesis protein [Sporomusa malonica]SMC35001.1 phenazine biosynthesis protein PhzF family [Sporomusa malonica]
MLKYYVADAFADNIFEGNPAGVCVMDEWIPIEKMEKIAIENNLSETAFAVKEGDTYGLRWFTPGGEIDLCGHATLATAYILFRFVETDTNVLHFNTQKMNHHLLVTKKDDLYEMDFPTIIPEKYHLTDLMVDALGAVPIEVLKTSRDLIFIFDSEDTVKNLTPDFSKIRQFPEGLSVYITAKSEEFDFVARAFWPKLNIDEDPVCGTMYCSLIPYWRERNGLDKMVARQVSKRGGTVYCEFCGERVKLSGRAALYAIGNICVDEK